jgi:hypothetical protein
MVKYLITRKRMVLLAALLLAFGLTSLGAIAQLGKSAPRDPMVVATTGDAPGINAERVRVVRAAETITGVVAALQVGDVPCWANRYACEAYDFELQQVGPIEVTLTWEGQPRALMTQLYWAGEGLAHEDVAPRTGPPRINFRRPMMEATYYRVRVVSLEPDQSIPFALTISY